MQGSQSLRIGGPSRLFNSGIQRLHSFAPGSKICALYPSPLLLPLSTLRVVILPLTTEDNFSTSNPRLLGLLVVTKLTFIPMYKGLILYYFYLKQLLMEAGKH
ncbi:hypothetical protein Lalb_Chr11g0069721 [Lupinus albus]|uniref:Uncharacterized protein n=1 Tax=Lupinus albus TaxID=3870 RepID=A0A6A4PRW3_LUPAL|nr:hypothetical protein Lalb_Chr11g0069721 [Lupinus albus]